MRMVGCFVAAERYIYVGPVIFFVVIKDGLFVGGIVDIAVLSIIY